MTLTTGRWLLDRQPNGPIDESHFRWDTVALPDPGPGELLVRHLYLSLDPGNRIWMSDRDWLRELDPRLKPIAPGETLKGATISIVEQSAAPGFGPGDIVQPALSDWSERQVIDAAGAHKVAVEPGVPLAVYLGSLGHTGLTAYVGIVEVLRLTAGDVLLVSGASGAVGRAAGEIARDLGAVTIGLTGGPAKVEALAKTNAFDHVLDARGDALAAAIQVLAPNGVDALFENVGGRLLDIGLDALKSHGRAAICGIADAYDQAEPPTGPSPFPAILMRRLTVAGFGVFDFPPDVLIGARAALTTLYAKGRLTAEIDSTTGLANAPAAFVRLMNAQHSGKAVVEVDAPPTSGGTQD